MPLQPTLVPVSMSGGIDTKTDALQVPLGKLLTLQNGQFSKAGQINKRYGYDILSTTLEGGGSFSTASGISAFNDELCLFDGNNILSYLPSTTNWLNRGTSISVIASSEQITRQSSTQQLNPDVAYLNGLQCYAWEDSSGGVRYSIIDSITSSRIVSSGLIDIDGSRPRCIAFKNYFYICYIVDNLLAYKKINPFNPTVILAIGSLIDDGYSDSFGYDLTVNGSYLFLGYASSDTADGYPHASGSVNLFAFDDISGALTPVYGATVDDATGHAINDGYNSIFSVVGDSSEDVWISWSDGYNLRSAKFTYALSPILASTLVRDTFESGQQITSIQSNVDPTSVDIIYQINGTAPKNAFLTVVNLSATGTLTQLGMIRSVGLASKAFSFNQNIYVNTTYESTLQATYFTHLISSPLGVPTTPLSVVAKTNAQVGGGLRTNQMLSECPAISPGIFIYANLVKGKIITEGNLDFSLLGVSSTKLDFENSNQFLSVVQSNNLLFVGGILQSYDGVSTTENGFHLYPEDITASASGSDGGLSTGTYQYIITYEFTDNIGQIQYSTTSVPITVNVTATNHVQLTIPTLRLTAKTGDRAPIIGIYRTSANGVLFNRVNSQLAALVNDPTVDTLTFIDLASDTDIAANELVYTTGGVLDNASPPANSLIALYQGRVMVSGLEDPNLIWFSKNKFDNTNFNTLPVEFSSTLTIGCDARGGAITALGVLDANFIIFKQRAIFIMSGDGPNDTGGGDTFPDPVMLTSDVGCNNPNSVVITPVGIMFDTDKGLYLLDRSLNVTYIGKEVEAFNSNIITSATLSADSNQVIFTTMGPTLIYDYYFQQWSTWTNLPSVDSDIFNGSLVLLRANGQVYQQNKTKFTDGTLPIYLELTTPNIQFNILQGYQRVYRMFILGSYKGPHTLNVRVAYDYNSIYTQATAIDATTLITTWGSDPTWGSGDLWGGEYQIYEFRVDFNIQKCTAIRIEISDSQSSNYNEGYSISALAFLVGILPGGNRLPATKTKGTS